MQYRTVGNQSSKFNKAALEEELKRVKAELAHYEHASEGASEGLWDNDLVNDKLFISPPWAAMLGYQLEEVTKTKDTWTNLMHPDDTKNAINALEDFIRGVKPDYNIQFRMRHKLGHYIWIQSTAKLTKDEAGNPIRVSGSHKDITENKNAEIKLQANELKYKNFYQNSLIGMMRINSDDLKVIEINKKGLNILSYPGVQNLMNMMDFFHEEETAEHFFKQLKTHTRLEEFDAKFNRWDESTTWVSISAITIVEGTNKFYDIVFRDISEFKENLVELQKLNFELDNFVYHASHDIRSPLRSLMGLIEILKTETKPGEIRKIIEMITGSINRLDKFVVDLLAMSRDNRVSEPAVPISFLVEVNNSITNFHHVYTTKNLEIRTNIRQTTPYYSDLTKIRIILNNLISNAIKYRKFEERFHSYIDIVINVSEEEVSILIEDNGEGIPKDKLDKIFEMFFRASENSEGSGLGMYIVKNVMNKLDAKISVSSTEGEGTRFELNIPNEYLADNNSQTETN